MENFNSAFHASSNILKVTVAADSDPYHPFNQPVAPVPKFQALYTLFPSTTHLNLDTGRQSFRFVHFMNFPSVTHVKLSPGRYKYRDTANAAYSYDSILKRLLKFRRLESLLLPARSKDRDMLRMFEEELGTVSAEDFRRKSVTVEYR